MVSTRISVCWNAVFIQLFYSSLFPLSKKITINFPTIMIFYLYYYSCSFWLQNLLNGKKVFLQVRYNGMLEDDMKVSPQPALKSKLSDLKHFAWEIHCNYVFLRWVFSFIFEDFLCEYNFYGKMTESFLCLFCRIKGNMKIGNVDLQFFRSINIKAIQRWVFYEFHKLLAALSANSRESAFRLNLLHVNPIKKH